MTDTSHIRRVIGPTILLASGNYFDFENPEGSRIELMDIAHGLSNICRFTGQCHRFYSVAEHSIHCSFLVKPEHAMAALLHDAAEAVMGDMSSPLKSMMPEYKALEKRVEAAILPRFGLRLPLDPSVKIADRVMLAAEQRQAMKNTDDWPETLHSTNEPHLRFLSPDKAYPAFIARFHELEKASRASLSAFAARTRGRNNV